MTLSRLTPVAFGLSLLLHGASASAQQPPSLPPPQPYTPPDASGTPYQPPPPGYYQPNAPGYSQPPPNYQPAPQPYGQPYVQPQPYSQPSVQPYGQPYVQPQPTYAQPAYQPAPRLRVYAPRFRPQFGLGARFSGLGHWNSAVGFFSQGAVGLDLLFRAHPRLTLELSVQYQSVTQDYYTDGYYTYYTGPTAANGFYYDRRDVPILAGARVHLGRALSPISPYVVGAFGATYARLYQPDSFYYEAHWFGELQGGAGLEIRAGRHFFLNVDGRVLGRFRKIDPQNQEEGVFTDGVVSVPAMGNQGGFVFNFGIGAYF